MAKRFPAHERKPLPALSRDEERAAAKDSFETSSTRSAAVSTSASLNGLRILSLESRHAVAMRNLLGGYGATVSVIPAMRELPLESHPSHDEFVDDLKAQRIGMSIWTTGVGVRLMSAQFDKRIAREQWTQNLAASPIIARGAKTVAALRACGLTPTAIVPPPHTWRQTLQLLDARRDTMPLAGRRVVLQEPGTPNRVLERALISRRAKLLKLAVYSWAMPQDLTALLRSIHDIIEGVFDVVMFSNGTQVWHLFKLAYRNNTEDELRRALSRCVLASIGPSTTAALAEFDLVPHLESPSLQLRDFVAFIAAYVPALAPRGS